MKKLLLLFLLLTTKQAFTQKFALIGDYGSNDSAEYKMSALVKSWSPEFIVTVGDNNYMPGDQIDSTVGKYFHEYIYPYSGHYQPGATENKFFPCIGNHDVYYDGGVAYYNYFQLPGNERYYDFAKGNIHFFILDGNPDEPDGITDTSTQALWLKNALAAAPEKWKMVIVHQPPFCSDTLYGYGFKELRWPFQSWGASMVVSGHAHIYEHLKDSSMHYIVNGLGGHGTYGIKNPPDSHSLFRYNQNYGAILCNVNTDSLELNFSIITGTSIERFAIKDNPSAERLLTKTALSIDQNFPNPMTGTTSFPISSDKKRLFNYELIDVTGKTLDRGKFETQTGKSFFNYQKNLKNGVYFIKFSDNELSVVKKITVGF